MQALTRDPSLVTGGCSLTGSLARMRTCTRLSTARRHQTLGGTAPSGGAGLAAVGTGAEKAPGGAAACAANCVAVEAFDTDDGAGDGWGVTAAGRPACC